MCSPPSRAARVEGAGLASGRGMRRAGTLDGAAQLVARRVRRAGDAVRARALPVEVARGRRVEREGTMVRARGSYHNTNARHQPHLNKSPHTALSVVFLQVVRDIGVMFLLAWDGRGAERGETSVVRARSNDSMSRSQRIGL
ncbi:hypothetical protein RR46_00902 [Papilio xuthus]|uniref:Uncharacterized protein n=1 Tax=Papilio xuthus TaxID=66420 RepID=A0A0N1I4P9_PAPXU|nr:hypothetical protein RR46_00902 [Papilio xuthus]